MDLKAKLRLALVSLTGHAKSAVSGGQTPVSRISAAIVRSTGNQDPQVDDKYVHEILLLVSNSPASVTFLAQRISHRLETVQDRKVALKTLLLLHRLLRGGDRQFELDMRNLCSSGNLRLNLKWFMREPDHPFSFLRYYAMFLLERVGWAINQAGKLEPIKPPPPPEDEDRSWEEQRVEASMYRLEKSLAFLDRVVMNYHPLNLSRSDNRVAQSAMKIILKESFQVYASFCEDVDVLTCSFNDLKKNQRRALAISLIRRGLSQSHKIHDFFEACKRVDAISNNLDYPQVKVYTADDGAVSGMENIKVKDGEGKEGEGEEEYRSSDSALVWVSCKLETKISTEWVGFEEEEGEEEFQDLTSPISFGGLQDCSVWNGSDIIHVLHV